MPADLKVPRHNTTERGDYLDVYRAAPGAIAQVQALFGEDFDAFGYSRDPAVREAVTAAKLRA